MTDIRVEIDLGARRYPVDIGRDLLAAEGRIAAYVRGPQALVVTDENVAAHYLDPVLRQLAAHSARSLVLPPGEAEKSIDRWRQVLDTLIDMGAQRDVTLVALGGGVVGDLAGFAAAAYMRGVAFVQVPTTLLAQVDASVGGKTAVNHPRGKNLVGAFHQPRAVLIDLATLDTLPPREFRAGLAEIIKIALIRDRDLFEWLADQMPALVARDDAALARAIEASVRHKAAVVVEDERERGSRALLNLGHTFGHAVETLAGYGQVLHGEAVAIGLVLAARLSARLGALPAAEAERVTDTVRAAGLPWELPADLPAEDLVACMRLDKKNQEGRIRLILLDALGRAVIRDDVAEAAIRDILSGPAAG